MRNRSTILLLVMATFAVGIGWRLFFVQDLTLDWYERHPVVPVTRIVDGQEVTVQERTLMYYGDGEFYMPNQFGWMHARYYVPLLMEFALLSVATVAIVRTAFRRWPERMWQLVNLLFFLIPLAIAILLVWPAMQAPRE